MTSLRNIEPKLVVKLQPFGTERDIGFNIDFQKSFGHLGLREAKFFCLLSLKLTTLFRTSLKCW